MGVKGFVFTESTSLGDHGLPALRLITPAPRVGASFWRAAMWSDLLEGSAVRNKASSRAAMAKTFESTRPKAMGRASLDT